MNELIPTGTNLRVGVALAPSASPLFVVKDAADGSRAASRSISAHELAR